jgi:hypothetical protein
MGGGGGGDDDDDDDDREAAGGRRKDGGGGGGKRGRSTTTTTGEEEGGEDDDGESDDPGSRCRRRRTTTRQHSGNRSNKGKTTGFNVFRSEYMRANAVSADADASDRRAHLVRSTKLAGAAWRGMPDGEKLAYKEKAKAHVVVVVGGGGGVKKRAAGGEEADRRLLPTATSGTTGFHVFRSERFRLWKISNPDASPAERRVSMIDSCREAGERWRGMPDAEKSPYHERAAAATENNDDDRKPKKRGPRRKRASGGGVRFQPVSRPTRVGVLGTESGCSRNLSAPPVQDGASAVDVVEHARDDIERISNDRKGATAEDDSRLRQQDAERRGKTSSGKNAKDFRDDTDFRKCTNNSSDVCE